MVRLTEAGQMLVRHADTITAAIAAAEADLAATRSEVVGTLSVAAFPTAARAIMPKVLAGLGRSHPKLRLMLRDLELNESLLALQMDEVDLAVVDEYDEASRVRAPGIETVEILRDPLYVAISPDAEAPAAGFALADLRDEPWIMDTEASTIFQVTLARLPASGLRSTGPLALQGLLRDPGAGRCRPRDRRPAGVCRCTTGLTRFRVAPLRPPLERTVLAAFRSERRPHPAVSALLAELAVFGAGYVDPVPTI